MSANAEIIAELRRVLNERDEAREQLDLTKRELGRWVDRETKAARERDEARANRTTYTIGETEWAQRIATLEHMLAEERENVDTLRARVAELEACIVTLEAMKP